MVSAKNKVSSQALKTDELASPIDLRADETRVTHGLIYRITDSRDHSSDLSGELKVSKEIFPFPPPRPRRGIYPENISFHLRCTAKVLPRE